MSDRYAGRGYISLDDCVSEGDHMVSSDDDGYCDSCGEQGPFPDDE